MLTLSLNSYSLGKFIYQMGGGNLLLHLISKGRKEEEMTQLLTLA